MHLHSGYYYYNYVIISVLRSLWLNRDSQLNSKNENDNLIFKNLKTILMKNMNRYLQKSQLNRLSIVHGVKTQTIIIMIILERS